jgi:hypothetical protein
MLTHTPKSHGSMGLQETLVFNRMLIPFVGGKKNGNFALLTTAFFLEWL